MAEIALTTTSNEDPIYVCHWDTLTTTDTNGEEIELNEMADRCVQVIGTFSGATLTMQGSIDGTTWATLTHPTGADIALTAAGIAQIAEFTRYVRPTIGATGDGSTDIDVWFIARNTDK